MKTVYAPDSAAAWIDAARDMAQAQPALVFVLCVAIAAFFATWASR